MCSLVEPTLNVLPQAHFTWVLGKYLGWMSVFIAYEKRSLALRTRETRKRPHEFLLGFSLAD